MKDARSFVSEAGKQSLVAPSAQTQCPTMHAVPAVPAVPVASPHSGTTKSHGVSGTVAPLAVSMARDGAAKAAPAAQSDAVAGLAATMRELLEVSKQQLACLMELKDGGYSSVRA